MTPLKLSLKTSDNDLLRAIKEIKDDNFKLSVYSTDAEPSTAGHVITFILTVSSSVVAGLILELLKKYLSKKPTEKTVINNIKMTNNASQVFITINNYIQQKKIDEDKGEKDRSKYKVIDSE
jgi:hypothetical protein